MASRRDEEPEEFKVVDRRLFTSEGERRPDAPPEAPPERATPAPTVPTPAAPERARPAAASPADSAAANPAAPAKSANAPAPPPAPELPPGAAQFDHLIMSLVTSAMYQLGMAAPPGQPPPPPDLPAAQETIDILGLLQQKTKGNLTPEEDELLTGSLQELRLAFVEMTRRVGRIR